MVEVVVVPLDSEVVAGLVPDVVVDDVVVCA
jgi:hypothetical protein